MSIFDLSAQSVPRGSGVATPDSRFSKARANNLEPPCIMWPMPAVSSDYFPSIAIAVSGISTTCPNSSCH